MRPNTGNLGRILGACVVMVGLPVSLSAAPVKIANFGFDMVNTSPAPTTPEEQARLAKLGTQLADMLQKSGRYDVVDTTKAAAALHASTNGIKDCNGCELPDAAKAGASQAVYGWVQKVSNLILNVNLVVEDAKTGKQVAGGSVDIRGNTDDSWYRGLHFLLEEHVLPQ